MALQVRRRATLNLAPILVVCEHISLFCFLHIPGIEPTSWRREDANVDAHTKLYRQLEEGTG